MREKIVNFESFLLKDGLDDACVLVQIFLNEVEDSTLKMYWFFLSLAFILRTIIIILYNQFPVPSCSSSTLFATVNQLKR